MKKYLRISLTTVMMICMFAIPGRADHYRYYGGGGPGWWPILGLGLVLGIYELSRPSYASPYYSQPPVIIHQQAPNVYVQPAPQYAPAPPAPESNYWYFCRESNGYYPYVKQCPQGWMKVVPTPPSVPLQASPEPAVR